MHKRAWLHLVVLVIAATIVVAAGYAANVPAGWAAAGGGSIWYGLLHVPDALFVLLGPLAAIAIATSWPDTQGLRGARRMLFAVIFATIVIDVWISPAAHATRTAADMHPLQVSVERRGVLRTSADFASGRIRGAGEVHADWGTDGAPQLRYPPGHARPLAHDTLLRAGIFFLPFIAFGIVLGAAGWMRGRVIFRSERDARVAQWALALVLAPALTVLALEWSRSSAYPVLFEGRSLWMTWLPYLPLGVLATVGWRAAARAPEVQAIHAVQDPPA